MKLFKLTSLIGCIGLSLGLIYCVKSYAGEPCSEAQVPMQKVIFSVSGFSGILQSGG